MSRRATCIASAAPPEQEPEAPHCHSAIRMSSHICAPSSLSCGARSPLPTFVLPKALPRERLGPRGNDSKPQGQPQRASGADDLTGAASPASQAPCQNFPTASVRSVTQEKRDEQSSFAHFVGATQCRGTSQQGTEARLRLQAGAGA